MHTTSPIARFFIISALLLAPVLAPLAAHAAEDPQGQVWYGSIQAIRGSELTLRYKGPLGEQYFNCSAQTAACAKLASGLLAQPAILGKTDYLVNAPGTYALVQLPLAGQIYYSLYNPQVSPPQFVALIPYTTPSTTVKFTPDGNAVLFINGANVTTYRLDTRTLRTVTLSQSELPLMTISYKGTYLAAYNYGTAGNRIWNLSTGGVIEVPNTLPSYLEFSADERTAVFLNNSSGFDQLYQVSLSGTTASAAVQLNPGQYTVADYLYVGTDLLYMANRDNVLTWSLYKNSDTEPFAPTASYGDYIKRVITADGPMLAYLLIEGKEQNANLYDPATGVTTELRPMAPSPAPDVSRTQKTLAGRTAVLVEPTEPDGGRNLFIWLHGGPQRQIAAGYHSYLSYAVYDEMLDRLVQDGDSVVKLDYTGSWGYGTAFMNALNGKIGVADVEDVVSAVEELEESNDYDNVYLIGNSYGGYLALRALTENPDMFEGAVSINGVTDWYGLISRIPSSPFKTLFNGVPDTHNMDLYMNASIYKATEDLDDQKILMVYGTADSEVPTWQTTEFYTFVQGQGKDITLLTLQGEEHIIRSRAALDQLYDSIVDTLELD